MNLRNTVGMVTSALVLAMGTASADTISFSNPFSLTNGTSGGGVFPQTVNAVQATTAVSLTQFNTNLGTLTGIKITVTSVQATIDTFLRGSKASGSGSASLTLSGTATGGIDLPGGATDSIPNFTFTPTSTVCSVTGTGSCVVGNSNSASPLPSYLTFPGVGDPAFSTVGVGSFLVNMTLDLQQTLNRNSALITNTPGQASVDAAWNGSVTVEYTFDRKAPPSIPEPSTMVLMGSALLGVGLIRKFKK